MKIDKNTIIGLILMALVMGGYMWYQNTTAKKMQEQRAIEAQTEAIAQHKSDSIESVQKEKKAKKLIEQINDSTSSLFQARQQNDGQTVLENELLKITIANKGGQIARAELKDPTYKDQKGKQVVLFDNNESNMRLLFDGKEDNIVTDELYFTPKNASKNSVTMSLPISDG
ncbi:MAG: YidC/Oxa1 family insertase periplasmic-domain containing protein, partial [Bacteroidaceae bacterium]|nr:YidC/Oxa1 family insertase periplasmic-domain containing protein [Bacteroidaceae bacterium]